MNEPPRTFLSVFGDNPGKITITLYQGSGADQVSLEKELTPNEMQQLHLKLIAALWWGRK